MADDRRRMPTDRLANDIYVAVVRPDLTWWDDLTPDMQDAWRRGAAAAVRWFDDDMRERDRRLDDDGGSDG